MGLGLFALGIYALYHLLAEVDADDVFAQVQATPYLTLAAALAATAAGYTALIGYDWSAMRYLGKTVPLRTIAVGGFLGYSFGNTIGVSVVSGGAVRYRIYSAIGLNAFEVASISAFVSIAFGLGITVIGLGALAQHPAALQSVIPVDPVHIQIWSAAGAVAMLVVLTWLSVTGLTLHIKGVEISAPRPGLLYGQLGFTFIDTIMAALTLYVLLPEGSPGFITILAVFSAATMAGVISHVPGGIGVFETIMIAAMPKDVPLDQVAAALLLFRIIYYLVPFALALAFVAINEARLAGGALTRLMGKAPAPLLPVLSAVSGTAPALAGLTAFGMGAYLIAVALMPSVRPDDMAPAGLLASILLEGGALLSAILGGLLLILSQGLARRISGAYWLTKLALIIGAVVSVLNGLDLDGAILLGGAAAVLWVFQKQFYRSAKVTRGLLSPAWFILIAALGLSAGALFFFMHEATPYTHALWIDFSSTADTARAMRAGFAASAVILIATVWLAIQPAKTRPAVPDSKAQEQAKAIINNQNTPSACIALLGQNALYFSENQDAFIMYGIQGNSWIAFGDPVGNPAAFSDLAWSFWEDAYTQAARPIMYEVTRENLPLWVEMGYSIQKIGEEATVKLADFSLSGRKFKTMRAAHNKAIKEGRALTILKPPHSAETLESLKSISDAWLSNKTGREKGFSVGRFDADYLQNFEIALVQQDGQSLAFATLMAPGDGRRVAIDLMRYRPEAAGGMMEFLFIETMLHFKEAGAAEFNLGMAPLAGLEVRRGTRLWNRFGATLFRNGGAFYNFEGLRGFKQKFQPEWHPRYIAVPPGIAPLAALKDAALLIAGGPRGIIGK